MLAALCGSDIIKSRHGALSLSLLLRFPLRCTGSFLRRVRNNLIWNTAGTERPWMFFTWHHYKDIIKSSQRACCARLGLRGRGWSRVGIGCQSRIIKVYPWIRSWILSSVTESKSLCICSFFHARRPQLHPTPPPHPDSERSLKGGGASCLLLGVTEGVNISQPWMPRSCTSLSVTTCSQTRCASTRSHWEASVSELFCLESYTLRDLPFFAAMHLKTPIISDSCLDTRPRL